MNQSGAVLLAVFRPDAKLLERQINSLATQTLKSWRCFIGIDGVDGVTHDLLRRLVSGDERFQVIEYRNNVGHYLNFERLTRLVPEDAQWVAYCDQDDEWYSEKLECLVRALEESPSRTAVVGAARVVDCCGNTLGIARRNADSVGQILLKNEVSGSFTVFHAEVVRFSLPFPRSTSSAVHDHWLGVCAAALGRIAFLREPMQDYVQHSSNAIGEERKLTVRAAMVAVRGPGGIRKLLDRISCDQWAWRVSMARALAARLPASSSRKIPLVEAVASGRLSHELLRFLLQEARARRIPFLTCFALAVGAYWAPRSRC